jgi:hypothetical protein
MTPGSCKPPSAADDPWQLRAAFCCLRYAPGLVGATILTLPFAAACSDVSCVPCQMRRCRRPSAVPLLLLLRVSAHSPHCRPASASRRWR